MQNLQLIATCDLGIGNRCRRPCSWLLKTLTTPLTSALKCRHSALSKSLSGYGFLSFFWLLSFSQTPPTFYPSGACVTSQLLKERALSDRKTERRKQEEKQDSES